MHVLQRGQGPPTDLIEGTEVEGTRKGGWPAVGGWQSNRGTNLLARARIGRDWCTGQCRHKFWCGSGKWDGGTPHKKTGKRARRAKLTVLRTAARLCPTGLKPHKSIVSPSAAAVFHRHRPSDGGRGGQAGISRARSIHSLLYFGMVQGSALPCQAGRAMRQHAQGPQPPHLAGAATCGWLADLVRRLRSSNRPPTSQAEGSKSSRRCGASRVLAPAAPGNGQQVGNRWVAR